MTENMTTDHMTVNMTNEPMKLKAYAEHIDKNPRTVRTWLDDGELPQAYQDQFTKDWFVPPGAGRVRLPQDVLAARRAARAAARAGIAGTDVVVSPANREVVAHPAFTVDDEDDGDRDGDDELTMGEKLDRETLFLTVARASTLLNIPQAQIKLHPEMFDAMPIGYGGSLMIPKSTLRRFEG